ncbi:MAG: RecB family exonuclease [Candidatus Nanoarchaeia archaeon]
MIYSHSRISTYEQCPLKFKFKYIDKLAPEIKSSIEGYLGGKVHEVLEWIYDSVKEGSIPTLDDTIEKYIFVWNKDYSNDIKIVNNDLTSEFYFNQGIKFLINYYTKNYPFNDNTLATECKIVVNLDKERKYQIIGYVDRLVFDREKNIYEIHDYKTGNFLKTQEELDKDRQLALYSIGVKEMFSNVKDIDLIWHFLAFNEKRTSKRTEEELEKLKNEVLALIKKIESTKEFSASPSILCKWCEFRKYCSFKDNYPAC